MMRAICALGLALALSACGGAATGPSFSTSATTVFTTGLNDRQQPVNSIEAIGLDQERFYVYTAWNQLAPGEHKVMARVLDADGKTVLSDSQRLNAQNVSASSVSQFQLNRYLQKPGRWTVEVYLDNERYVERSLKVLPAAD